MILGAKAVVGLALQNSFGTAPSANSYMNLPVLSESLDPAIPSLYPSDMTGVLEESHETEQGASTIGGDLVINVAPIQIGQLLAAALNAPVTAIAGSCYQHTFTPRSGDFDIFAAQRPCALIKGWAGPTTFSAEVFYDMALSALELSCAAGELMKCKAAFIGGERTAIAIPTPSFPAGRRLTWDVASLQVGSGTGLAAHPNWESLTLTLDNGIEAKHVMDGSQWPGRIERSGWRKISLNGTFIFDSQLEYDAFTAQSQRAFIAFFTGKEVIMTNTRPTLRIDIPALRYKEFKRPTGGPGRIKAQFSADADYHVGSAGALKITLANTYAAY